MLAPLGIEVTPQDVAIDEIQHHDPLEISRAKVRAAYAAVGAPVVVNDSLWEIPALGGFPGGYMKDVMQWLNAEDFLNLMRGKQDRRIILHDTVAYYDGREVKIFSPSQTGRFINQPRGDANTFQSIVVMDGSQHTIAENFARRDNGTTIDPARYPHWQQFGEWWHEGLTTKARAGD